jgi:hypothetical protein
MHEDSDHTDWVTGLKSQEGPRSLTANLRQDLRPSDYLRKSTSDGWNWRW